MSILMGKAVMTAYAEECIIAKLHKLLGNKKSEDWEINMSSWN